MCRKTQYLCGFRDLVLFSNTFFKNVFLGRRNNSPWPATKPKNRIKIKAFALFGAEAFLHTFIDNI